MLDGLQKMVGDWMLWHAPRISRTKWIWADKLVVRYTGKMDAAQLQPGYQTVEHCLPLPIPATFGQQMIDAGLFSQGNDFTNGFAKDPHYQGNSLLRRLWEGETGRACDGAAGMRVWVIEHEGARVGVVAWLHTDYQGAQGPGVTIDEVPRQSNYKPKATIDTAPLGYVMCFMDRAHRGRGLVKQVLQEHVCDRLLSLAQDARARGLMPTIAAVDATRSILKSMTPVPLVSYPYMCQALRAQVWRLRTQAQMYPEIELPFSSFLVEPRKLVATRRPRR